MKVAISDITDRIKSKPTIDEISEKLFQLGHEHEIKNNIFDIEFTPNRGDCLSVKGILRDLSAFYEVDLDFNIFQDTIETFNLNFTNKAEEACPVISFLKIDVKNIRSFDGYIKKYFDDFNLNNHNFFTDISNYVSYEQGQPTHCYDANKIDGELLITFDDNKNTSFQTLLDKNIKLNEKIYYL